MKQRKWIWTVLFTIAVMTFLLTGMSNLAEGKQDQEIEQLEQVLHQTAVACYAAEGAYPPSIAYMRQHYGLTYDESRYIVHYEVIASNIMPNITVMERTP